jgi:cysteine desulfurase
MVERAMVYLDNAATTMACPEAVLAAANAAERIYGNPSSLHSFGFEAEQLVNAARREIAESISADPDEIIFTPGGTFADNLAVIGAARRNSRQGRHIITSSIEHSAVLNAAKHLQNNENFDVTYIRPDKTGHLSAEDVSEAVRDDTILVSVMYVNNELGTLQPVKDIAAAVKRRNFDTLVHTDAVQAYTKIKINVRELGVDMLTLSGHKIHALKGSGAIYIKKGTKIAPLIFGGGQEEGLAPGTEPVPLIASFAAAAKAAEKSENFERVSELRDYALEELALNCPDIRVISRGDVPHIFMVSLPGFKGETVLYFLEQQGIFVSTGSACSRGKPSHVLSELGLEKEVIEGALRISLSRFTTKEETQKLVCALSEAPRRLVKGRK